MRGTRPYVVHYCRNKKCNAAWLAPDINNVKSRPPQHLYCFDCEVFEGMVSTKSEKRVKAGKRLLAHNMRQREIDKMLEGLL